jgi:hypothetical protein
VPYELRPGLSSLSIGGIPLLILATLEKHYADKSGGISPVIYVYLLSMFIRYLVSITQVLKDTEFGLDNRCECGNFIRYFFNNSLSTCKERAKSDKGSFTTLSSSR